MYAQDIGELTQAFNSTLDRFQDLSLIQTVAVVLVLALLALIVYLITTRNRKNPLSELVNVINMLSEMTRSQAGRLDQQTQAHQLLEDKVQQQEERHILAMETIGAALKALADNAARQTTLMEQEQTRREERDRVQVEVHDMVKQIASEGSPALKNLAKAVDDLTTMVVSKLQSPAALDATLRELRTMIQSLAVLTTALKLKTEDVAAQKRKTDEELRAPDPLPQAAT